MKIKNISLRAILKQTISPNKLKGDWIEWDILQDFDNKEKWIEIDTIEFCDKKIQEFIKEI